MKKKVLNACYYIFNSCVGGVCFFIILFLFCVGTLCFFFVNISAKYVTYRLFATSSKTTGPSQSVQRRSGDSIQDNSQPIQDHSQPRPHSRPLRSSDAAINGWQTPRWCTARRRQRKVAKPRQMSPHHFRLRRHLATPRGTIQARRVEIPF